MTPLIALLSLLTIAALAMGYVLREDHRAAKLPVITDWIEELSVERYTPMLRLLDRADPTS